MISTGLSNLHTLFHLILNYFIIIIFVSQIIFNYLSKAEEFSAKFGGALSDMVNISHMCQIKCS